MARPSYNGVDMKSNSSVIVDGATSRGCSSKPFCKHTNYKGKYNDCFFSSQFWWFYKKNPNWAKRWAPRCLTRRRRAPRRRRRHHHCCTTSCLSSQRHMKTTDLRVHGRFMCHFQLTWSLRSICVVVAPPQPQWATLQAALPWSPRTSLQRLLATSALAVVRHNCYTLVWVLIWN
jgi:hypothetical protein